MASANESNIKTCRRKSPDCLYNGSNWYKRCAYIHLKAMKSLRYFSTISLLALATVLASAQDGGLGRGRGGGGGTGGGQSSPPPSRPSSPPPASPPASSPPPSRSNPPQAPPPPVRGGDSNPGLGRPNQDSGLGRGGSNSGGSQSGGPSRDRGGSGTGSGRDTGGSSQSGGPSRDRGGSSGGSSQSGGPSRDRGGSTSGGPTRGGGDSGLGRPNQDSGLGRSRGSGSSQGLPDRGRTTYNTNSNVRIDRAPTINPISVPPGIVRTDELALKARRQDGTFRGNDAFFNNGWRTGYCHYNTGWNDNFFFFPNYCFNPWQGGVNVNVVISPWYLYPFLPGYLNCNTVVVSSYRSPWIWNTGAVYVYDDRGWDNRWGWNDSRRNVDLDNSLEDLRDGFERYDRRSLGRLVPRNGQVAIMRDGRYDYSMNADDFYDLINDLSSNAETNSYRVEQVRTYRDSARVVMLHDYNDPWGRRQRVYHSMLLQRESRGQMVIREFETNDRRAW